MKSPTSYTALPTTDVDAAAADYDPAPEQRTAEQHALQIALRHVYRTNLPLVSSAILHWLPGTRAPRTALDELGCSKELARIVLDAGHSRGGGEAHGGGGRQPAREALREMAEELDFYEGRYMAVTGGEGGQGGGGSGRWARLVRAAEGGRKRQV